MKILIFHQYYRSPAQPGSTRMYYFAEQLLARGHELTIITGAKVRGEASGPAVLRLWPKEGLEIISIQDGYRQGSGFPGRMAAFLRYAWHSLRLGLQRREAEVVFASSTPLTVAIPAIAMKKLTGTPYLFEVRDLWPDAPIALGYLRHPLLRKMAYALERSAYRNAGHIIALSRGIARKIGERSSRPVSFIPNSVDGVYLDEPGAEKTAEQPWLSRQVQAVYAGSCGFNNAIDTLVGLILECTRDPELKDKIAFTVIGDGPGLDPYREELAGHARLTGRLPKQQVVELLRQADIGLYPQRKLNGNDLKKDSLPNKLFDYLGAELAIVAAVEPDGETAALIREYGLGRVSPPEDVPQMRRALEELVRDRKSLAAIKEQARRTKRRFSRSAHAVEFARILEETARHAPQ
jgi:glycosyltransferase involved in cell wall biosynthesis